MLILGIDTATDQVSAAIGGHEGVLGSVAVARGRRHAETLTPAIEFLATQTGIGLDEIGVVAVDVGPGLFTGLRVGIATAKAMAYALRVPMIGVASLDLVAFPLRFSPKTIVAAIDARRGEVFYATYRATPGGRAAAGRLPQVGAPAELVSEERAPHAGSTCSWATVPAATPTTSPPARASSTPIRRSPTRRAWALVQLAHAQALREEFVQPWEIDPLYLRTPDAEANWTCTDQGLVVIEPTELEVEAVPSGAAGRRPRDRAGRGAAGRCAGAPALRAAHRGAVLPQPWTMGLYLGELALARQPLYLVARRAAEVVGYGGVHVHRLDECHITTLATDPQVPRRQARHPHHVGARPPGPSPTGSRTHDPRGAGERTRPAIALYRRFGFAPAGVRKNYYAEVNEDALVMWANDIHAEEYAARLDRLGAELDPTGTAAPDGPVPAGPGSSGEEAR